jgi:hypothetical protein
LSWIVAQGIGTALIEPGKPWQNGVTESFNGKFRDECLSLLKSHVYHRYILVQPFSSRRVNWCSNNPPHIFPNQLPRSPTGVRASYWRFAAVLDVPAAWIVRRCGIG